jgi:putative salt-induced outer membrane protein YdiY
MGCWSTVNRIFTEDLAADYEQCGWRKIFRNFHKFFNYAANLEGGVRRAACGVRRRYCVKNSALPVLFPSFIFYLS